MRIQYMSDLHLEFRENSRFFKELEIPVTGDVLVLAGDTMYLRDTTASLGRFWKWASANYQHTNIDTVIGNTKIVSNQLGYTFRNEHLYNVFDPGKFLEL